MRDVTLLGGGLAGALLGVMLARRGVNVALYERRADLRKDVIEEGRSINLALSARGLHALSMIGMDRAILDRAIPMKGRFIHPVSGTTSLIPYGRTAEEVIYSVSRRGLNAQLLDALARESNAKIHFQHRCIGYDVRTKTATIRDENTNHDMTLEAPVVIGTDGASSAVRASMMAAMRMNYSQSWLAHGYKELTIPPGPGGEYQLEPNALHIWPRGGFMMIALPNLDRTFTCTLFLAHEEFEKLSSPNLVTSFFKTTFSDALPLLPNLETEFFRNPTGGLWTVRCAPWHLDGQALLLGDAAHAIVPFFGQGMNCAFEDCVELAEQFDQHNGRWPEIFPRVFERRKHNADAIAEMALENFIEMRDTSADPKFALKRQLEHKLEEHYPGRFISKYSMVSFHRLPYVEALERGRRQDGVLQEICAKLSTVSDANLADVMARIEAGQRTGPLE